MPSRTSQGGAARRRTVGQFWVIQSCAPITVMVSTWGSWRARWSSSRGGTISSAVGDQMVTGWVTERTAKAHGSTMAR